MPIVIGRKFPPRAVLLRYSVMRPLSDIPNTDHLAGLAWYYWLLVERVRSANATAEEKQLLLSEIELWFDAARRKCLGLGLLSLSSTRRRTH